MDRLTKLINPNKIFMGEKDYQQFYLVKKFIEKRYLAKLIMCKTIRNKYNVAYSSRNLHLTKNLMNIASMIVYELKKIIKNIPSRIKTNKFLRNKSKYLQKKYNVKIEYLELRNKYNLKQSSKYKNSKLFIAFYLNKVRLIDNF